MRVLLTTLLVFLAGSVVADTTTSTNVSAFGADGTDGWWQYNNPMVMTADGYLHIYMSGTDDRDNALLHCYDGSTWTEDTVTENVGDWNDGTKRGFGRDNYAYWTHADVNSKLYVVGWEGAVVTDTVFEGDMASLAAIYSYDTSGALYVIDQCGYVTDDSLVLWEATSFPSASDPWPTATVVADSTAGDQVVSYVFWGDDLGGVMYYYGGVANKWLFIDTAYGVEEFATGVHNYDNNSLHTLNFYSDTFGIWIEQYDDVAGADSIVASHVKISQVGTGSGDIVRIDTTTLESAANVADGSDARAVLSHVHGTDTVIAYWVYWDAGDPGVKRCVWDGSSWGTPEIFRQPESGATLSTGYMWAPETIYIVNDTLREWLGWHNNPGTDGNINTFHATTEAGGGDPGPTATGGDSRYRSGPGALPFRSGPDGIPVRSGP